MIASSVLLRVSSKIDFGTCSIVAGTLLPLGEQINPINAYIFF